MKAEYETLCAEAEEALRVSGVQLPLSWMVEFILDYAETGFVDPEEFQDMARQIRIKLDERVTAA